MAKQVIAWVEDFKEEVMYMPTQTIQKILIKAL